MQEQITVQQEDDELVYKLIVNNKMVCGAKTESYNLLLNIKTTEGEEGKGYAKKLLTYIEKVAREHNAKTMKTDDIDPCNYRAVSLFKSMGYAFTPIVGDASGFIEATKDLNAPNEKDNQNCLEEARNSLLQHYSSKSTNQTAILLGLAIAFFTAIQAYSALDFLLRWEKIVFLVSALAIIIFLLIRQISRLITWGELATASTIVEIIDRDAVTMYIKQSRKKYPVDTIYPESVNYAPTYLHRLSIAASEYFGGRIQQCKKAPSRHITALSIRRLVAWPWFKRIYLVIAIAVLIAVMSWIYLAIAVLIAVVSQF